jgi:hypothetical protein
MCVIDDIQAETRGEMMNLSGVIQTSAATCSWEIVGTGRFEKTDESSFAEFMDHQNFFVAQTVVNLFGDVLKMSINDNCAHDSDKHSHSATQTVTTPGTEVCVTFSVTDANRVCDEVLVTVVDIFLGAIINHVNKHLKPRRTFTPLEYLAAVVDGYKGPYLSSDGFSPGDAHALPPESVKDLLSRPASPWLN